MRAVGEGHGRPVREHPGEGRAADERVVPVGDGRLTLVRSDRAFKVSQLSKKAPRVTTRDLALKALTTKQLELIRLAERFRHVHSFAVELRRATKGKRFAIRNRLAWDSVISGHRVLIIDLSEWIGSFAERWLGVHLQGGALAELRASKRKASKFAEDSPVDADPETSTTIRRYLAETYFESFCQALRRLFGPVAERRRSATDPDVRRLEKRLQSWREPLAKLRNAAAHAYGDRTESKTRHRLVDLRKRIEKCARLLNDLRLLLDCSTYSLPNLEPSEHDAHARDLVDLIIIGTIQYAAAEVAKHPGHFYWQQRDAEYARLHRRRRKSPTASFND